jgi:RNA polymerase sigma-70 factor (ECF subfamily)
MNLAHTIQEIKNGSDIACQHLLSAIRGPMMALCCRYLKDSRDAEERMLDGYHKCLTGVRDFNFASDARFYAWLKKIMIRECVTYLRTKKNIVLLPEIDDDEPAMEPEVVDKLSEADIFKMLDGLPPGYRIVFNLHALDGIEHKDIAQLLGIKESTSRSQLTKARVCLQKILILNGYNHVGSKSME